MPTLQPLSPEEQRINLEAWNPLPGEVDVYIPDEHFIRYTREMMIRGDDCWPPSIISYYGHPIPLPNVELQYLGRGKNFLKLLVTFKKRKFDSDLELFFDEYSYTLPAWQGENNLIHLIETLPTETDKDLNMEEFYEQAEDIDKDYLARMRQLYDDEELTHLAPEVFYYPDPASGDAVPDW